LARENHNAFGLAASNVGYSKQASRFVAEPPSLSSWGYGAGGPLSVETAPTTGGGKAILGCCKLFRCPKTSSAEFRILSDLRGGQDKKHKHKNRNNRLKWD
jgi:hypothetical protein